MAVRPSASCGAASAAVWLLAAAAAAEPAFEIGLVDVDAGARRGSATVRVDPSDLELVDPASVHERARPGQGHLHFRVDDGPVIATTSTKLSFHELGVGSHRIEVALVGNDHRPLGPRQVMDVTIPGAQ
jgi:hypothetical protein